MTMILHSAQNNVRSCNSVSVYERPVAAADSAGIYLRVLLSSFASQSLSGRSTSSKPRMSVVIALFLQCRRCLCIACLTPHAKGYLRPPYSLNAVCPKNAKVSSYSDHRVESHPPSEIAENSVRPDFSKPFTRLPPQRKRLLRSSILFLASSCLLNPPFFPS